MQNTSGRLNLAAHGGAARNHRMDIAKHYLTTSSTFFVGWAWVAFLRDLAAVWGQSALNIYHSNVEKKISQSHQSASVVQQSTVFGALQVSLLTIRRRVLKSRLVLIGFDLIWLDLT